MYGQTVILHTLPLKYVVIILCQNLSILNAPVAKFLNELNRNLLTAITCYNCFRANCSPGEGRHFRKTFNPL